MTELSLAKDRIHILLLEGIHDNAVEGFRAAGYTNVEHLKTALAGDELRSRLADAHMVGIRSRTRLTADVLESAHKLFCVGCFCIGTNQVDLDAAKRLGIPVFNAPYSNTRSVAELIIGEIIMLFRGVYQKSVLAHTGVWAKSVTGSREIRGKVLGIVGYGHIGSQLSVLAEAMVMRVRYYDIVDKLSLGNARPCGSLDELLSVSDVVSLHVPATPLTRNMIRAGQLETMRPGSFLLNASRGNVVDIDALADALRDGHITGAAVDVYPTEPSSRDHELESPLRDFDQVIMTPHVGGSTHEAQESIGSEVADKLIRYSDTGATEGAVNFAQVSLPVQLDTTRFLHVHGNVPGVLAAINRVFSERHLNIAGQYLQTDGEIGYVVVDITGHVDDGNAIRDELREIDGTLRVRFLY
jgi:D-3-phosphoglycerate dehydrogenase